MVSGGKYAFPSTSMVASLSARVMSFQTAFMLPRTLGVQYFIPNGLGPHRALRPQLASRIRRYGRRRPVGPGAARPADRPHRLHGGPGVGGQACDMVERL